MEDARDLEKEYFKNAICYDYDNELVVKNFTSRPEGFTTTAITFEGCLPGEKFGGKECVTDQDAL
jgi:hypothetical protein